MGSSQGKSASPSMFKKVILSGVWGETVSRFWEIFTEMTLVSLTSTGHSLGLPPVKFRRKSI